jgi:hypothetical protein
MNRPRAPFPIERNEIPRAERPDVGPSTSEVYEQTVTWWESRPVGALVQATESRPKTLFRGQFTDRSSN